MKRCSYQRKDALSKGFERTKGRKILKTHRREKMNIHVRRRRDTFIGMKGFRTEFPEDFPAESDETEQMDEIETVLGLIEQYGGEQALGLGNVRFNYNAKGISRENLREMLEDFELVAESQAYKTPGIDLIFRLPRNLSDAQMLAVARSFVSQAPTYEAAFKQRLGTNYLTSLQTAIADFEASLEPPESAASAKVEATAQLGEAVRRGMIARRVLQSIMKLKYKNNPSRMRGWESASHIERDNKDDKAETPPPA